MKDYIKQEKQKRRKGYLIGIIFILLVFIICILAYYIYLKIDITNPTEEKEQNVTIAKMSQTVEQVQEQDKRITEVLQEVNQTVVGISKVKEAGDSVFLEDGVSKLGLGTGLIVSENGYILTNEHVSGKKNSTCYITMNTSKTYTGTVVWSNSDIDMAIIKINEKKLKYATLGNSDDTHVGQTVYAIGNPIGYEFQRTVTSGIISAKDRTIKLEENGEEVYMEDLIQTDATINPGNSGGPLINANGEVIGINSVKITSAEGIGFAVPINVVKPIIEKYMKEDKFEEAALGIFAYDKNMIQYIDENIDIKNGIYVAQISLDSPAAKSGLKVGDVITKIDNLELNKMCDLRCYIYTKSPGNEVNLTVYRNKKENQINVKLGTK